MVSDEPSASVVAQWRTSVVPDSQAAVVTPCIKSCWDPGSGSARLIRRVGGVAGLRFLGGERSPP